MNQLAKKIVERRITQLYPHSSQETVASLVTAYFYPGHMVRDDDQIDIDERIHRTVSAYVRHQHTDYDRIGHAYIKEGYGEGYAWALAREETKERYLQMMMELRLDRRAA